MATNSNNHKVTIDEKLLYRVSSADSMREQKHTLVVKREWGGGGVVVSQNTNFGGIRQKLWATFLPHPDPQSLGEVESTAAQSYFTVYFSQTGIAASN